MNDLMGDNYFTLRREWTCPKCKFKFTRVEDHPTVICSDCGYQWENEYYIESTI